MLAGLPRRAGYGEDILAGERVQAAIVVTADGDIGRLRQMLDLAMTDWRDLLVAAGLADADWRQRLTAELGDPLPEQAGGRQFRHLGFLPAYSCQVDPEHPGGGDWGCPVHGFSRDGHHTCEAFCSRWGTPMLARFALAGAATWVGWFEAGDAGRADGVFACPDPLAALVVCRGQAYLVSVGEPARTAAIAISPVTHVTSAGTDLIVLAGFDSLTAIGPHGQVWASERLCLDNLRIVSASADRIDCLGDFLDATGSFTVNAHDGTLAAGRRFLDTWPGQ